MERREGSLPAAGRMGSARVKSFRDFSSECGARLGLRGFCDPAKTTSIDPS